MESELAAGTSASEAARSLGRSSLQPRGGVKCRQHDVSRATVNKDRRENYRVASGGEGGGEEGELVEVRVRTSRARTYAERSWRARGVARGLREAREAGRGARGPDLPGRDVSLTHSVSLTQTDVHHGQAGS